VRSRAITLLAALAFAGCGSDPAPPPDPPQRAAPAPAGQLLFALPKLGELRADCRTGRRARLTYRAGPAVSERVQLFAGDDDPVARDLAPRDELTISAPFRARGAATTTELVRLRIVARGQPFDVRATVLTRLGPAPDETGECVALRATSRVETDVR
jgi:hypothetical protein